MDIMQHEQLVQSLGKVSEAITHIRDYKTAERLIKYQAEIMHEIVADREGRQTSSNVLEAEKISDIETLRQMRRELGLSNG